MQNIIYQASSFLCESVLGFELGCGKSIGKDLYGSCILLKADDKVYEFFIFFKKQTLHAFGKELLGEDDFDDEQLKDLSNEIANLIIGKAKCILSEQNEAKQYTLLTPKYLNKLNNSIKKQMNEIYIFKVKNANFVIGVKNG